MQKAELMKPKRHEQTNEQRTKQAQQKRTRKKKTKGSREALWLIGEWDSVGDAIFPSIAFPPCFLSIFVGDIFRIYKHMLSK